MSKRVADLLVETLQTAGVKTCYGIVGDTMNLIAHAIGIGVLSCRPTFSICCATGGTWRARRDGWLPASPGYFLATAGSIFLALALFDPDDHAVTVNVGELQRYDL